MNHDIQSKPISLLDLIDIWYQLSSQSVAAARTRTNPASSRRATLTYIDDRIGLRKTRVRCLPRSSLPSLSGEARTMEKGCVGEKERGESRYARGGLKCAFSPCQHRLKLRTNREWYDKGMSVSQKAEA